MSGGVLEHPVFRAAMADLEVLGVRVAAEPQPGAREYGVVGSQSNSRWWLVPLQNGAVAASGLALFQPLMPKARWMKAAATLLSHMGLQRLSARHRVYVWGEPPLARYFPGLQSPAFAYFTGTESPHRKVAVQVMDARGNLKGFAKVTRRQEIGALLAHEARMLQEAGRLALRSGHVPQVLFSGCMSGGFALLTDTLKTPATVANTSLTDLHREFLRELADRTRHAEPMDCRELAAAFRQRTDAVRASLPLTLSQCMDAAIAWLERFGNVRLATAWSQGDFTPWNTFPVRRKLYVFDWEYANQRQLAAHDLLHFVLNQPDVRSVGPDAKIAAARQALNANPPICSDGAVDVHIAAYVLSQLLMQIERCPGDQRAWDGASQLADMLALLPGQDDSLWEYSTVPRQADPTRRLR